MKSETTTDSQLAEAIADAKRCALETGLDIYIIKSRIYADEFADSPYVWGCKEACLIMYPKRDWMTDEHWQLCGVVDTNGEVFLTKLEDVLAQLF